MQTLEKLPSPLLNGALAELTRGLDAAERSSAYVLSIIDGVTGKRHRTPRRFASARARMLSANGIAGFGQWRRRRSMRSMRSRLRLSSTERCKGPSEMRWGITFVVTKIVSRGTSEALIPSPTAASLP